LTVTFDRSEQPTSPVTVARPSVYRAHRYAGFGRASLGSRAAYVIDGAIACGHERAERVRPDIRQSRSYSASGCGCPLMLLGGALIDGQRHIWRNSPSEKTW